MKKTIEQSEVLEKIIVQINSIKLEFMQLINKAKESSNLESRVPASEYPDLMR